MSTAKGAWICIVALGVVALILGVGAVAVFLLYFDILKAIIHSKLALRDSSMFYDSWVSSPYPSYVKFYFFSVVNHMAIARGSEEMVLQEFGPYTFRKHNEKRVISWDEESGTVTYEEKSRYVYVPEMSIGTQKDVITIVNLPLLGIVRQTELNSPSGLEDIAYSIVDDTLDEYKEKLFINRTVEELLFKGYQVPAVGELLDLARSFLGEDKVPDVLPNNTFGLYYGKNNTYSEEGSIYTGSNGIDQYMIMNTWNNMSTLLYWKDQYCNMINGTDGRRFPPPVGQTDKLYVFVPDICRSVYFEFEKMLLVHDLQVYRFVLPAELFSSGKDNSNNMCFCKPLKLCDISGITPISPCYMDVPLVASAPHFYMGEERLLRNIKGLAPSKRHHQSFVDVEPVTGTVVKGARRIQINAYMKRVSRISEMKRLNKGGLILPVFWISETSEIEHDGIDYLFTSTRYPLGRLILLCIMTLCSTSVIMSLIGILYLRKQQRVKLDITKPAFQMKEIKKVSDAQRST